MFSMITRFFLFLVLVGCVFLLVRLFLYRTALIYVFNNWVHWVEDRVHVHQSFKVPELNDNFQENQFYGKVLTYVNSLTSMEDSDFTNLFAGKKSNDIVLCLDDNQTVHDEFLGARVSWTNAVEKGDNGKSLIRNLILRVKKKDKRRILRPYLQHIHTVSDEIELSPQRDVKLYMNTEKSHVCNGRWRSVPFTHPSTLETIAMDSDLKNRTTSKSIIVIEDLDRFMAEKSSSSSTAVSLSGVLNFMDGIVNSCCSDEKVMVFTMNNKERMDSAILRPGRIDVHIHFPLCDFSSFKSLANSYLGLKDHKLFPQVEEVFQSGATLSPAEVGEIMISNRSSPSRALKSVITAAKVGRRLSESSRFSADLSSETSGGFKDSSPPVRELRKLYGLLKLKSTSKIGPLDHESTQIQG
ncbi:hypothetical protein C3L33_07843, partial [Rhododendron williamsianum]